MNGDFPKEIVHATSHRPWPPPDEPWLMTQSWHDLLFAHWSVDVLQLRKLVPAGLDLDLFDGRAWIGIVPFHMTNVAPRGVPALPWLSAFPELNVRTYVTLHGKPGVYFFSLDATSAVAVAAARTMFGLPYYLADMEVRGGGGAEVRGCGGAEGRGADTEEGIAYRSRRTASGAVPAELVMRYRPTGPIFHPEPGTLEYFLTERYCLYTVDAAFRAHRLEIHHPPWPLQPAEAVIEQNTMADAAGIRLPSMAPLLHFARRQDVVAYAMHQA